MRTDDVHECDRLGSGEVDEANGLADLYGLDHKFLVQYNVSRN